MDEPITLEEEINAIYEAAEDSCPGRARDLLFKRAKEVAESDPDAYAEAYVKHITRGRR
jgi:hypothetical protein